MTNTQLYALEQACQIRTWHRVQPHLQDQLAQMTDEQVRKFVAGGEGRNPLRSRAFRKLAEPYLPRVWQEREKKVEPIPELRPRCAQGIVDAQRAGFFGDNERWLSIAHLYDRIYLSAKGDSA